MRSTGIGFYFRCNEDFSRSVSWAVSNGSISCSTGNGLMGRSGSQEPSGWGQGWGGGQILSPQRGEKQVDPEAIAKVERTCFGCHEEVWWQRVKESSWVWGGRVRKGGEMGFREGRTKNALWTYYTGDISHGLGQKAWTLWES